MKMNDIEVLVVQGDITQDSSEAIVNAANNQFSMGGGVAAAIKRKGGKSIEDEAAGQGPVKVGESVISSAGSLSAKYVIHAATMAMDFKTDEAIIRKATYSALLCAQENKIKSIAFCALGCGVGGFSYEAASKVMAQEVFRYSREVSKPTLARITFVLNNQKPFEIFSKNVVGYLEYMLKKMNQGPFLTVDGIIEYKDGIVMIERSNPPLGWALPGGFVDYGESIEQAVIREMKEETGLDFIDLRQFRTYSAYTRDPRFHTVSVVFIGRGQGVLKADSDAKAAGVFQVNNLPEKIAFDHKTVIEDYIKAKANH